MQIISLQQYEQLTAEFEWQPFTQSVGFLRSQVNEKDILCLIDNTQSPQIATAAIIRKKLGKTMLLIKGEQLKTLAIKPKLYKDFYNQISQLDYDIIELNLNTPYSFEKEIALRQAGFLRPVGLFSTTLSKSVDTTKPLALDKSWQRNLKIAENANLKYLITSSPIGKQLYNYCKYNDELLARKQFSDKLSVEQLKQMFADNRFALCYIATADDVIVAGGIFYVQPKASTFLYSFTTLQGRELAASYYLYEVIIRYLNQNHIPAFDLGRLSPAAHSKNNLFLFKDGISGDYINYVGEWQICKQKWMPLALYMLKKNYWKLTRV